MTTITKKIHLFSYKRANVQRKFASNSYRVSAAVPRRLCSIECNAEPVRRSGNYKPSVWEFDRIQSLTGEYEDGRYLRRASELVEQVRTMLEEKVYDEVVEGLVLIDDLQRLGISCHFRDEIEQFLSRVYEEHKCRNCEERDLYSTCLEFRLLRQHGFKVSQEVFDCFKNEKGSFNSIHSGDTNGLLQLYEASFLLIESEKTLETAREFSSHFLRKKLEDDDDDDDEYLSLLTRHALEFPIHWRIQRHNARWFIDVYEKIPNKNPVVLEHAKLDFNIVQATYQQELKQVSRWWKSTSLAEKLPFARDRLVECFYWSTGILELRRHGYQRIMTAKVNALITTIDDIYDVYGTLEELQLFTNSIRRLANDLGTSADEVERGDVPKSIQCYMNERNASEKEGAEHAEYLIREEWKKMNQATASYCPFSKDFIACAVNFGRMARFMYGDGDGQGVQHSRIHDHITDSLFKPYPYHITD